MSRRQRKRGGPPATKAGAKTSAPSVSTVESKPLLPAWLRGRFDLLGLVLILVIGVWVHWIYGTAIDIGSDDVLLMEGSRKIDAGVWRHIWAPQHAHFVPLYRLARLPFDLHFPAWYAYFHALVLAAHLASTVLLYLLARRYLRSKWAALLTAALFGWSTVGYEALVWKAAAPFAFSWTFLLLCAWCLTRTGPAWTAATAASLFCAVGFFSGALFAIPGLFLWSWLLEPQSRRGMLRICLAAGLLGSAAWLAFVVPAIDFHHYWAFGGAKVALTTRLLWAVGDTWNAYAYQLGVGLGGPDLRYLFLLLLAAGLFLLRRKLNTRWILSVFVFTLPPLLIILLIRRAPEVWKVSRYAYQSYVFWVVLLGSLADALLWKLEPRRMWRITLLAVLPLCASCYLVQNSGAATDVARKLQPQNQQRFWFGWEAFFRLASQHRTQLGAPLRVPSVEILPDLNLQTIYVLCHPRGLPGITLQPGAVGTAQEQEEFWSEIEHARPQIPWLPRRTLPPGHTQPHSGS